MNELREKNDGSIPVLLLTGLTSEEDILRGLKNGGDDYLTKPYDFAILLARVERYFVDQREYQSQLSGAD